jgi:hypothetical protein
MTLRNFTPHTITIHANDDDQPITIPSIGVIRLVQTNGQKQLESIHFGQHKVPVYQPQRVENIEVLSDPDAEGYNSMDNIIVSMVVAQFLREKKMHIGAIFVPGTGPQLAIRDEQGRIVGTRGLERYQ